MIELICLKKNNKYYLRHKLDKNFEFESYIFDQPQLISFSKNWIVFNNLPSKIQQKYPEYQKIVEYILKPGFGISNLTPVSMPNNSFEYIGDDNYRNSDIRGLYEPKYEKIPEKLENIEFNIDIIDQDCEPLIKPKYKVITDFPFFIDNHDAIWHKYPCHIDGKELYNIIRKFIKDNMPENCIITSDYDFHICVELKAPLLHEETITKNISRTIKPKYEIVPLRTIIIKIIDISAPGDKYGKEMIESMSGIDYYDLENKIDNLLAIYSEKMTQKLFVCPHCKGYGFQSNAHTLPLNTINTN